MPVAVSDSTEVEGSVQLLWPRFSTALEKSITSSYVPEHTAWPIAVFDTLAANTDRAGDNWGIIEEVGHAVLIDHGHAFEPAISTSEFAAEYTDQRLSPRMLSSLEQFLRTKDDSRLYGLLDDVELDGVFARATQLIKDERLTVRTP
jgi:Phosphatidylinositol 3- and 4-kinase